MKKSFSVTFQGRDKEGPLVMGFTMLADSKRQAKSLIHELMRSTNLFSIVEEENKE